MSPAAGLQRAQQYSGAPSGLRRASRRPASGGRRGSSSSSRTRAERLGALQRFLQALWPRAGQLAGAAHTRGRTCADSAWRAPRRGARRRARSSSRAPPAPPRARAVALASRRAARANSHGLPSAPRASITAAAPVAANASRTRVGVVQAAGEDHGRGQRVAPAARRARSRACLCGARRPSAGESRSPRRPPRRRGGGRARSRCARRGAAPSAA